MGIKNKTSRLINSNKYIFSFFNKAKCKRRNIVDRLTAVDHLTPETVAAFVDCELSERSQFLVMKHILVCENCKKDVLAQQKISGAINNCCKNIDVSTNLMESLNKIGKSEES